MFYNLPPIVDIIIFEIRHINYDAVSKENKIYLLILIIFFLKLIRRVRRFSDIIFMRIYFSLDNSYPDVFIRIRRNNTWRFFLHRTIV